MIKIVPDTNIIISSIFWRGNPYKLMKSGFKKRCLLFISIEIVEEIIDKLKNKFKLPDDRIEKFTDILLHFTYLIKSTKRLNVVKEDPTDNKIIECAVEGKADYIVSGDEHLLKLKEYQGIKIVKAREMLEILGVGE